jgi:hypothetical protein
MDTSPVVVPEAPVAPTLPESPGATVTPAKPFSCPNRSRAERVAKLLFGVSGRTWIGRSVRLGMEYGSGVEIGTEIGATKKTLGEGYDFTEALAPLVESYLKGGNSYEDTKKRLVKMQIALGPNGCLESFVEPALSQFKAEYEAAKQAREREDLNRFNKLLEGPPGAEVSDLAAEAMQKAKDPLPEVVTNS